jgi:hypothetical protein
LESHYNSSRPNSYSTQRLQCQRPFAESPCDPLTSKASADLSPPRPFRLLPGGKRYLFTADERVQIAAAARIKLEIKRTHRVDRDRPRQRTRRVSFSREILILDFASRLI